MFKAKSKTVEVGLNSHLCFYKILEQIKANNLYRRLIDTYWGAHLKQFQSFFSLAQKAAFRDDLLL